MPTKYEILLEHAHRDKPKDGMEEEVYELEEALSNDINVLKNNRRRINQLQKVIKDLEAIGH